MKLKKFDSTTANGSAHKPRITFSHVGTITVNKDFYLTIKLEEKGKLSVIQDEENPDDWYLLVGDDKGFTVRFNKSKDRLLYNSAATTKTLLDHFRFNTKSITFQIATEPTEVDKEDYDGAGKFYGILTHTAKYIPIESPSTQSDANSKTTPGDQNNS